MSPSLGRFKSLTKGGEGKLNRSFLEMWPKNGFITFRDLGGDYVGVEESNSVFIYILINF